MSKKRIHGNRKNAMLKVLRKNRGKSGYRVVRHMASMILNDEVSANSIMKRATKHYTVVIKPQE